jgi:hypothetical protein
MSRLANRRLDRGPDSLPRFSKSDCAHIAPTALLGTGWHDVMTYCSTQWLSSYTYEASATASPRRPLSSRRSAMQFVT